MPLRDMRLKRPKVQGTQGPHPFPRISGMTPNRIAPGPVGRVAADLSGQGNHVTDRRTRIEANPLKQVARNRSQSLAIDRN
jgi:hypothetical protein